MPQKKSKDLVRIAVAKAALMDPLAQPEVGITQKGLVIGGGVAGMTAALGLADQGFQTYLLEKAPVLGGLCPEPGQRIGPGSPLPKCAQPCGKSDGPSGH